MSQWSYRLFPMEPEEKNTVSNNIPGVHVIILTNQWFDAASSTLVIWEKIVIL